MAAGLDGLRVVFVSDPSHPVEVGHCPVGSARGVAVDSGYAYVAAYINGLRVVSIADPAHPVEVGHYRMSSWANATAICGGYVYVAYGLSGLQVFQYFVSGVEESIQPLITSRSPAATIIRTLPVGTLAFDAMGRRAVNPRTGIHFVREDARPASQKPQAVRKVVLQR